MGKKKVSKAVNAETDKENVQNMNKKRNKKSRIDIAKQNIEKIEEGDKPKCVIYIGHLPWGFNEDGIKKYFSQFGEIEKTFMPRSRKTGRSKGYAFVQFNDEETAQIAAETMNNFILFDRILKCSVVEDTKKYTLLFLKSKRKFKFCNKYKVFVEKRNKEKSPEETKSYVQHLLDKEEERRKKFKSKGIKYDFPGYKQVISKYTKKLKEKGL